MNRFYAPSCVRPGCRAAILAFLLVACGDSSPTAPPDVSQVTLTVPTTTIELGDSVQLTATASGASGQPLSGRVATWTSSNTAVLRVSGTGMAVGLAAGTATVVAEVDGRTASAIVTVLAWNIADNVEVVDSTVLRLVSDSTERTAGRLRFEVLQAPAPAFVPGIIVVGAQSGGFLRRVTSASASGSIITLETEPAAVADAVESGGFASTINLIFDPGVSPAAPGAAAAGARPGAVLWGEGSFSYMAPGLQAATAASAGFDLSGLDICELLAVGVAAGGSACPQQLKKFVIRSGRLEFEPSFGVDATFDGFSLETFRGVADGALTADFALALEAEGQLTEFKATPTLFTFTRPFIAFIGGFPVVGYIELELTGELSVKATAKAAFEAGFEANGSVQVGAEYNGSWEAVIDGNASFEPRLPAVEDGTLKGTIELAAAVALKPRLQMIFYGVVGPFAEVKPFGEATLAFGTTCGVSAKMALNAAIGFTIPFLDSKVSDFAHKEEPLFEGPAADWPCPLGTIDVSTVTNGENTDDDGYTISVDDESQGSIDANGQLTIPFVEIGAREVSIDGLAGNCTVQGTATRAVTVTTGGLHAVDFVIDCTTLTGEMEITTSTTGAAPDPDGYTVTLDGATSASIGANQVLVFENVAEGTRTVELSGVESNCTVAGSNPASVAVTANQTAAVRFDVNCAAAELVVRNSTSGPPASTAGWTVTLDDVITQSIPANGQATFATAPGQHGVRLDGLPANCQVSSDNPAVVDVAVVGMTEHVFAVECQGAGLIVAVTTDGDPDPATGYTVTAGGQAQSVGINGSVEFTDLPAGNVSVRLDGLPGHCTVQGLNPRAVQAPGGTTFQVICQAPAACTDPPANGHSIWNFVGSGPEGENYPWSSGDAEFTSLTYGNVAGHVAAASSDDDRESMSQTADMEWKDHLFLVPIDPARADEQVTLRYRHVGHVEMSRTGAARTQALVIARGDAGLSRLAGGENEAWQTPQRVDFDDVVTVPAILGQWNILYGQVTLRATAEAESATAASASSAITLIDVRDASNQVVPIAEICTSSGTQY